MDRTKFKVGDAIIHPIRGAGIVERVEERQWRGKNDLYYRIKLMNHQSTNLMVPINVAEDIGLRRAIPASKLNQVWHVLGDDPIRLPNDHKARYKLLKEKLHTGDVFQVAEVVRDMAWRQQREGRLNTVGKRIYERSIKLLAGEIAATQGTDMVNAEARVRDRVKKYLTPTSVM